MQPVETIKQREDKITIGWYNRETWKRKEEENKRIEEYGLWLNDGDFEKWQPCCYYDGGYTEQEWDKLKLEAWSMEPDVLLCPSDPEYKRQWCRIMWIRARFFVFLSNEWRLHNDKYVPVFESIIDYLMTNWWEYHAAS